MSSYAALAHTKRLRAHDQPGAMQDLRDVGEYCYSCAFTEHLDACAWHDSCSESTVAETLKVRCKTSNALQSGVDPNTLPSTQTRGGKSYVNALCSCKRCRSAIAPNRRIL